ncbi:hypothetical protein D3C73_1396660 [compost metagenome]
MHGRFGALGTGNHLYDLRQHGLSTHLLRFHHQAAMGIERCPNQAISGSLHHRHGLTRQHRLIDRTFTFQDRAIDRNLFSRPHPQAIPLVHMCQRNIFLLAIGVEPACRLG